ncbi:hypothetical protein NL676_013523 [Syzygium grande]|nr:hypothetical protein NL676_013523 [Syzygium grande]
MTDPDCRSRTGLAQQSLLVWWFLAKCKLGLIIYRTTLACLQNRNTGRSLTRKGSDLVVSSKKGSTTAPRLVKAAGAQRARADSRDVVELDVAEAMFSQINAVSIR